MTNPPAEDTAVLEAGRNCWCIETSERTAVIVETADYFAAFAEACENAREQILILGWDFDRHEDLFHDDKPRKLPTRIGAFLAVLTKRRPELKIYLLSWDFNMIYAVERELFPALRLRLQAPKRFHFRLDGHHPSGASHHQKVVVVDDVIAFSGGIDLSRWRWDTCEHKAEDSRRVDSNGKPYPPFHDMMFLVEGPAAQRLGNLARERWLRAHGWQIPQPGGRKNSPWPASVSGGIRNKPMAIARTVASYEGQPAIHEVKQLYLDAVQSARDFIYIENQYFTSQALGTAICKRLAEENGPDVVIVLPEKTGGWLEQMTMDVLRGRVVKQMQEADRHHRLRVFFPFQPGLGENCISVHAKLLIVDDRFLRIGSSNTSNRSMGLDTECDLAMEAGDEETQNFIRDLRLHLLCEHLDVSTETLTRAESEHERLGLTIDSLLTDQRSLRTLNCSVPEEIDDMVPDDKLVDPTEPYSSDFLRREYVPEEGKSHGRQRGKMLIAVVLALLALAAAWRFTPLGDYLSPELMSAFVEGLDSEWARAAVTIGGVAVLSLFMVPLTALAVVAGIVFGTWQSFLYVVLGSMLSAIAGFLIGEFIGKDTIEKFSSQSKLRDISKRVAQRGVIAVAILRLVPVAPFTVFNLIAGASHLGFRQYTIGTLLGLTPGIGMVTLFSGSLWQVVTNPDPTNVVITAVAALAVIAFGFATKKWLQ
ncbi:MAG: VTT domain-containing protein [Gammaproteobacteria bacterium]|nr:VTT domain-containing protein [Gammaproteobacteria bacterium]